MQGIEPISSDTAPAEDPAVERLLQAAGPPPAVPADFYAEVHRAAHVAWQAKVAERRTLVQRRRGVYLLAASVVLALGAVLVVRYAPTAEPVAAVEAWFGVPATGLEVGKSVTRGAKVTTGGASRVALRLQGGASLRLDCGTSLVFVSPSVLELERGAVYLDTGGGAAVEVRTSYGVATDVGTQFEVRLGEERLELRVREGEVRLALAGDTLLSARAGVALTVHGDGMVERGSVPASGDGWRWVLQAAPSFELEGKTVAEALDWIVRETGWELRFSDPELRREAETIIVHGSLAGVPPQQAPEIVLLGSGLAYRLEEGNLFIERIGK